MADASALLIVIITFFIPPVGVALIAGCGVDLLINICLTLLGYIPGHIHAFYLEYIYYSRRDTIMRGGRPTNNAAGIYSRKVQDGGFGTRGAAMGGQRDGLVGQGGQQNYGTVH